MAAALCAIAAASVAHAADTIKIGSSLALTGPAAAVGVQQLRGIETAVEIANKAGGIAGRQIQIISEDHQAKPDQAVLIFNRLADLHSVPVVITGFSGPTLAVAPLATRKKILVVNGAAQADKLATASPYMINMIPSVDDEVKVVARYVREKLGKTKVAILYDNSAPGISARDDFREAFKKLGGTVVEDEQVAFAETNFRAALLKLTAAKPEVLFVQVTQGAQLLAEQLKQMQTDILVMGTNFFVDPALAGNRAADGWIHTQFANAAPDQIQADFKTKYGTEMEFHARQYFNATNVTLQTIAQVVKDGKAITGESLRETLFKIKTFGTETPVTFNTNTVQMPIMINKMQDGRAKLIDSMVSE